MKNQVTNWMTILITAAVGVLFIVWHNEANLFQWLVRALGIMLLLPGVYILFNSFSEIQGKSVGREKEQEEKQPFTVRRRAAAVSLIIVSAATVFIAAWMLIQPGFFAHLIAYLFAAILLLYGIYQFIVATWLCRPAVLPWYFYIIPSLFVAIGIVILVTPLHTLDSIVTLCTGILLLASAINSIIQAVTVRALIKSLKDEAAAAADDDKKLTEGSDD